MPNFATKMLPNVYQKSTNHYTKQPTKTIPLGYQTTYQLFTIFQKNIG